MRKCYIKIYIKLWYAHTYGVKVVFKRIRIILFWAGWFLLRVCSQKKKEILRRRVSAVYLTSVRLTTKAHCFRYSKSTTIRLKLFFSMYGNACMINETTRRIITRSHSHTQTLVLIDRKRAERSPLCFWLIQEKIQSQKQQQGKMNYPEICEIKYY